MTAEQLDLDIENRSDAADRGEIQMTISRSGLACPGSTLTTRQLQCLRGIEYAIRHFNEPPTRLELCSMLGIRSQRSLRKDYLGALETKGFIRVDARTARGIAVLIPSSEATVKDRPGLAKAKPRAADARKAVG